jgi:hypothetical protein
MVTAAAVALIGGVTASSAQAQQRDGIHAHTQVAPRHDGREIEAAPNTRDMGVRANPDPCSGDDWSKITADDVNIRRQPWGTVIGHADHTDSVSNPISSTVDPGGGRWVQLVDYTRDNVLGYIYEAYVYSHSTQIPCTD